MVLADPHLRDSPGARHPRLCKRDCPGPTQPGLGKGHKLAGGTIPSASCQGGCGLVGGTQWGNVSVWSRLSADCLLVWFSAVALSAPPSAGALGLLPTLQEPPAWLGPHLRSRCSSLSTRFRLYSASFAASLLPSLPRRLAASV